MNTLTVYKASAGSGKTFRLAVEYIKQLIMNTTAAEGILAVTFTNKATEEMKMRILSQLYGLAEGLKSSDDYMERLLDEIDFTKVTITKYDNVTKLDTMEACKAFVRKRAAIALKNVIHAYSSFKVQTIDKFFQSVLRNLAHELNLSPNLSIELNDKEIVSNTVNDMIDGLRTGDVVLNWIMEYIRSNMDEFKNWNIISNIKTFGRQILNDEYKANREKFRETFGDTKSSTEFFSSFRSDLLGITSVIANGSKEYGKRIHDAMEGHGYSARDLTTHLIKYIENMPKATFDELADYTKTVRNAAEDTSDEAKKWVKSTVKDTNLRTLCATTLRPILSEAIEYVERHRKEYFTAKITLAHISELRLLESIRQHIEEANKQNERFFLSDTQNLLSKMISGSDTPFIYEKLGARLNQIMIDEFQDTSSIQWQNFKVLLADCMSHGHDNLIVGDVKQSIYRWRNGDWRLLNNIGTELGGGVEMKTMDTNYRSARRIVNFNNTFFRNASRLLIAQEQEMLGEEGVKDFRTAFKYSDVMQLLPKSKADEGYVEVKVMPKVNGFDYEGATLEYISDTIKRLIDNGYSANDIAIIVRQNSHIPVIAEHIKNTMPGIDIVSDEAFMLSSSAAVRIIINAIKYMLTPDDNITKAMLAFDYQHYVMSNEEKRSTMILRDLDTLLPSDYINNLEAARQMTLQKLTEHIYNIFNLTALSSQNAYICMLFDCLSDFTSHQVADAKRFINHWNETLWKKNIESEANDGIRIISIHKSKGLEYPNVIMPYSEGAFSVGTNVLWCHSDVEPYCQLPLIPIDYKKNLNDTHYSKDYRTEHMQISVDNLNLLYVGFTRASRNLFVITKSVERSKEMGMINDRSTVICETMDLIAKKQEAEVTRLDGEEILDENPIDIINGTDDNGFTEYTYGELLGPKVTKADTTDDTIDNVFETKPSSKDVITKNVLGRDVEFRQSNASKQFTETDDDAAQRDEYIVMGTILHNLLSTIETKEDIGKAMLHFEQEGLLDGHDITYDYVRGVINNCMNNTTISDWFSGRWRLFNECTILERVNGIVHKHRPDRVMTNGEETIVIDFKLKNDKPEYHDQVHRYMETLQHMGYQNIRGYLLFILPGKIKEVL